MIAAISAVIGVIVSIIALIKQSNDTHLSLGIQLLRDLEKQFESEEMKQSRITLSTLFINREQGAIISSETITSSAAIADFFSTVGMLLKRNVLDLELTWAIFAYWLIHYWEILEKDINEFRKSQDASNYWSEFEYLYKKIAKYDARKSKIHQSKLEKTEIQRFLKEESQLKETILNTNKK